MRRGKKIEIGNIQNQTIPEFPIRNLKMDDPGGTCPSDRPSLISGLEIPESFDYEVSLKSLDLAGFLIALEHDVPAEDDDQQPENPIVFVGYSGISQSPARSHTKHPRQSPPTEDSADQRYDR